METKKTVQISYVIIMIMMVIALIYAGMMFAIPEFFISKSFPSYVDQSWSNFMTESPKIVSFIQIMYRNAGGVGLALVLGSFFVMFTAFRKGEKWACYYSLVSMTIAWGNVLLVNISLNNNLLTIVTIIGLALLATGLIIPAKDFLGEKKTT